MVTYSYTHKKGDRVMQLLKYETHTHTSEVSRCSRISSKELVRFYKECGYSGICITDHFLNGNTTVPAQLPWAERIELFCRGYEGGYEEGRRIGINVFFWLGIFIHGNRFIDIRP